MRLKLKSVTIPSPNFNAQFLSCTIYLILVDACVDVGVGSILPLGAIPQEETANNIIATNKPIIITLIIILPPINFIGGSSVAIPGTLVGVFVICKPSVIV